MKCPSCGSDQVDPTYKAEEFRVPYGPSVEATLRVDKCLTCESVGDFENLNDARILQAIADSTRASIPVMVDILKGNGYTLVYCERALRIPFGSFKKWLEEPGSMDPGAVVMLRMVATYPWLLQAADDNFRVSHG
jgi:hypothetical protein